MPKSLSTPTTRDKPKKVELSETEVRAMVASPRLVGVYFGALLGALALAFILLRFLVGVIA